MSTDPLVHGWAIVRLTHGTKIVRRLRRDRYGNLYVIAGNRRRRVAPVAGPEGRGTIATHTELAWC